MGRQARAKQSTPASTPPSSGAVKLEAAEFYQLLSKLRQIELARVGAREKAARLAFEMVQKETAALEAEGRVLLEAVAARYGLDPKATYQFHEASCELTVVPLAAPQ